MNEELYASILSENLLSNTKSRKMIFNVMHELHRPVTLPELIRLTSSEMNKTTVYRIIESFQKVGIVKKVNISWRENVELSDLFKKHHHHLVCTICKSITEFEESAELNKELDIILDKHKFKATSHNIEFSGVCRKCRNFRRS